MRSFSTQLAAEVTGATVRQLGDWDKTGLVKPSGESARGRGSRRRYTFEDLVAIRTVVELRSGGCSLQKVRKAVAYLKEHFRQHFPDINNNETLARVTLLTDGDRVYLTRDEHEIIDVVSRQMMFAVPVGWLVRTTRERVEELPQELTEAVEVEGKRYHLLVSADEEAGGYIVQCRELPGALEQGESVMEAVEAGREAIASVLAFQRRRDRRHVRTG